MILQTTDRTSRKFAPLITSAVACDDCRSVAPGSEQMGEIKGGGGYWAERAGFTVKLRGSLLTCLCPACSETDRA